MKDMLSILKQINSLLGKIGETFWNKKISNIITKLDKSNIPIEYYCEIIKEWYGGMGSFNDLYICKENGYNITDKEEVNINKELQKLREDLYNSILVPKNLKGKGD